MPRTSEPAMVERNRHSLWCLKGNTPELGQAVVREVSIISPPPTLKEAAPVCPSRERKSIQPHTEPHAPGRAAPRLTGALQTMRVSESIPVEWGGYHDSVTGRSENPNRCMMIELGEDVVSPFSYLRADNTSTPFAR